MGGAATYALVKACIEGMTLEAVKQVDLQSYQKYVKNDPYAGLGVSTARAGAALKGNALPLAVFLAGAGTLAYSLTRRNPS
jgi:hypothetical protein